MRRRCASGCRRSRATSVCPVTASRESLERAAAVAREQRLERDRARRARERELRAKQEADRAAPTEIERRAAAACEAVMRAEAGFRGTKGEVRERGGAGRPIRA